MKHVFLSIFALGISYCALSQNDSISLKSISRATGLKAGTIFVGASSNFSASKDSPDSEFDESYSNITFSPNVGLFVAKRLLIGTEYQLQRDKRNVLIFQNTNYATSRDVITREQLFSIFARYYIGPWKIKPFIGIAGGIGSHKTKSFGLNYQSGVINEIEQKFDIKEWKVIGGVSYFIIKRISLDGSVSFGRRERELFENTTFVRANFGFSLFF